MPKFFIGKENISDNKVIIDSDNAHHIKNVLRKKVGDVITVSDAEGTDYSVRIESVGEKICAVIEDVTKNAAESDIFVTLIQCLPKASKMEYIIQKCTELGICEIIPCISSRCVVKLDGRKECEKKKVRWQNVCEAAAKQSGRGIIPSVHDVVSFSDAIALIKEHDLFFAPYESEEDFSIRSLLSKNKQAKSIAFIIGPEGGFSPNEVKAFNDNSIPLVTLGRRILRTETAGEATLAMINYEYEL